MCVLYRLYLPPFIATFNVEHLNVTPLSNGSVNVECILVNESVERGSPAGGCHVIFSNANRMESFNIIVPVMEEIRIGERIVSLSVSGSYIVEAYDLLMNGTIIGPSVTHPTLVEVNIPLQSSSNHLPSSTTDGYVIGRGK